MILFCELMVKDETSSSNKNINQIYIFCDIWTVFGWCNRLNHDKELHIYMACENDLREHAER